MAGEQVSERVRALRARNAALRAEMARYARGECERRVVVRRAW